MVNARSIVRLVVMLMLLAFVGACGSSSKTTENSGFAHTPALNGGSVSSETHSSVSPAITSPSRAPSIETTDSGLRLARTASSKVGISEVT